MGTELRPSPTPDERGRYPQLVALGSDRPKIAEGAWVAPTATLVGAVEIAEGASVWYGAVLRGDNEPIIIGPDSNVQDNVVFHTARDAEQVKAALERRLQQHAGKPVRVLVRTAAELARILAANPFPEQAPNRTVVIFLDDAPAVDALATVSRQREERVALGEREIYVDYGAGMADSKLRIPAGEAGTGRNMNTVARLASMARYQVSVTEPETTPKQQEQ